MPKRRINGSRVIVTGASSGIGWELAKQLYAAGAQLVVTARREERLQALADEIGQPEQPIVAIAGDVTDPQLRLRLIDTAHSELGGLDILINNAGIGAVGPFAGASEDRLRQIMEVNFFAPVELIRAALPALRKGNQPIVVNISSVLGHCAVPDKSEYCASKFAMHGFTDSLHEELSAEGIDVLLVSPSTTDSEFFDQVIDRPDGKPVSVSPVKMPPEVVARKTIAAIRRGRREIILSKTGKLLVWSDRLAPSWMSWFLTKK